MLIILTGLPGTGKSTVAAVLARELGARVLSTDRIRVAGRKMPGFSRGDKGSVYERMFARAARDLADGRSVILDATFYLAGLRRAAAAVGRRAGVPVFIIEIASPRPIVKLRMGRRLARSGRIKPAGFEVYGFIRRTYEPVRGRHFVVDTASPGWRSGVLPLANTLRVVENQRRIIAPLRTGCPMRLIQTHISWILLDGAHAYKIKKPVRFSFVDYTSPARRLAYCRREIEANSRLSPELYEGVVPVRDDTGAVSFGGPGRTVDHAVAMREMPQDLRLDRLAARGRVRPDDIMRIVRALCEFHARAGVAARRYGSPQAIRDGFEHAFRLRALIEREFGAGAALDLIREKVDGFLSSHLGLFRERVRQGRIRHCHGDLRMSNIFMDGETVRIFDAVEFNPGLASTDVAADVAYLAMDLRAAGKRGLAERLIDAYAECAADEGLRDLADFYQCYRALVRILVESLVVADPAVEVRRKQRARQASRKYLALAEAFACRL